MAVVLALFNPFEALTEPNLVYPNRVPENNSAYRRAFVVIRARGHAPGLARIKLDITTRWCLNETLVQPLLDAHFSGLANVAVDASRSGYRLPSSDLEHMVRVWQKLERLYLNWSARDYNIWTRRRLRHLWRPSRTSCSTTQPCARSSSADSSRASTRSLPCPGYAPAIAPLHAGSVPRWRRAGCWAARVLAVPEIVDAVSGCAAIGMGRGAGVDDRVPGGVAGEDAEDEDGEGGEGEGEGEGGGELRQSCSTGFDSRGNLEALIKDS